MRKASEMKELTLLNCEIVKYVETTIAPQIEQKARVGSTDLTIEVDELPTKYSRTYKAERVKDYLTRFGYIVDIPSNTKTVNINWDIK